MCNIRFLNRNEIYEKSSDRLVVESQNLTEAERLENQMYNVPVMFVDEKKEDQLKRKNLSCARLPNILDLKFNNIFWQKFQTFTMSFYLFNAFYENRTKAKVPHVRFLGMVDKPLKSLNIFCQFWFDDDPDPVISDIVNYNFIWYPHWGNYKDGILQPYLITFKVPESHAERVPKMVSLVEHPCDQASNSLRVIYNRPNGEQKKFAVCVKGLTFPDDDLSLKIIEWIEVIIALGADKIYFYDLDVHPNITKVI